MNGTFCCVQVLGNKKQTGRGKHANIAQWQRVQRNRRSVIVIFLLKANLQEVVRARYFRDYWLVNCCWHSTYVLSAQPCGRRLTPTTAASPRGTLTQLAFHDSKTTEPFRLHFYWWGVTKTSFQPCRNVLASSTVDGFQYLEKGSRVTGTIRPHWLPWWNHLCWKRMTKLGTRGCFFKAFLLQMTPWKTCRWYVYVCLVVAFRGLVVR